MLLVTTSDINQSAGVITATNFIVDADGSATLTGDNVIDRLAADVGVDFTFNNTIDLLITELTCDGTTVNGLTVGSDAELTLTGQALTNDRAINVTNKLAIESDSIDFAADVICNRHVARHNIRYQSKLWRDHRDKLYRRCRWQRDADGQ